MLPSEHLERNRVIIVVGAGLAGLVCAGNLLAAGRRVLVLEAEDMVGGRVRTTVTDDGFRIDRGFQVLFSAYPALRRQVPVAALQPKYFSAGVELVTDGRSTVLGHPLFDVPSIASSIRSGLLSLKDLKALTWAIASSLRLGDGPLPASDRSTREALRASGVSEECIDRVISPFFGGVSLDRSLASDSTFWLFVLRNLVLGRVFLPAYGVGQLTQAVAARLPSSSIRLNTPVTDVVIEGNRAVRVVAGNQGWDAQAIVLATEAPVARDLVNVSTPEGRRSCTTAYFVGDEPITTSRRLILNAKASLVNHAVQLTNISSAYAPRGKHLLSATALDLVPGDDSAVASAMLQDMRTWLPNVDRLDPLPVAVVRVPYAQFAQEPGVYRRLPRAETSVEALYLAGEFLHSSSVQGAIRGGELAAQAVLGMST